MLREEFKQFTKPRRLDNSFLLVGLGISFTAFTFPESMSGFIPFAGDSISHELLFRTISTWLWICLTSGLFLLLIRDV